MNAPEGHEKVGLGHCAFHACCQIAYYSNGHGDAYHFDDATIFNDNNATMDARAERASIPMHDRVGQ